MKFSFLSQIVTEAANEYKESATFSFLSQIVTEAANEYKESAAYSGAWNDGGCDSLLCKLADYKNDLVIKFDLRPSEFGKLNDIEVGEPKEFSDIIEKYKIKLAKNIKL